MVTRGREGALILGGDHGSLGVARSLGRKGIPVYYITDDNLIAKFSKYVVKSLGWEGPASNCAVDYLMHLAERDGLENWLIYPAGDREVTLVSQNHARLSRVFRLCTMPWETLRDATDKSRMYAKAESIGIAHPQIYNVTRKSDLIGLDCLYPVIVKPSVKESFNALTREKVWKAHSAHEVAALYDLAVRCVGAEAVIIQEMIPGDGETQFSYTGVWHDGRPIVSVIARRTRQYPVEFGTGTYVETVDEPKVEAVATKFLRSLSFQGMVEIEFKYDDRDGQYKILDVNPRVWTWNSIGLSAGVDYAYVQWLLARGETVEPHKGKVGAKWLYALKDVFAASKLIKTGSLSFSEYLATFRRRHQFAAFAWDDPLPGIVDVPLVLRTAILRATRVPVVGPIGLTSEAESNNPSVQ